MISYRILVIIGKKEIYTEEKRNGEERGDICMPKF